MRKLSAYGPSLLVIATAALVLVMTPEAVHRLTYAQTSARIIRASERLQHENVLEQINQAYRDIAEFVEPSVVHITAQRASSESTGGLIAPRLSSGSGWVYDAQGHIVTNHHVIEGSSRIDVQLHSGEIRAAEWIGSDPSTDIAVLKISPQRLHPAVRRAPDAPVRQGDLVFAFGSPFDFRFSMSSGVVSGQGRSVGVIRSGPGVSYENFIQVDAAINPGNSGGPLTDFRGHVIGMNTAIATGARWFNDGRPNLQDEGQFAGIGLAIPVEMIEPVVNQLITTGEVQKGYVGVYILDRQERLFRELELAQFQGNGVLLAAGAPDLYLSAGELLPGDVITRIAGRPVFDRAMLVNRVSELEGDADIELTVWRFDDEQLSAARHTIGMPAASARKLADHAMLDLDATIASRLELAGFTFAGVPVVNVDRNGPAHQAGIRRGDVIVQVNGQSVGEVRQVQAIISSVMPDQTARLRVWRLNAATGAGETIDLPIIVGRLDPRRLAGAPEFDGGGTGWLELLGIRRMQTLTPELASELRIEYQPGVVLIETAPNTELARRVRPGAIIVRVSDRAIASTEELIDTLGRADLRRRGVRIGVVNPDGSFITMVLRAP